ncbi:LOW QUALITY PROTEIN: long-chain-fatty-acid-CoA ligase [Geomicrobium sp. JCM 19039]|nr:LOW QUALITY PROTEIN: long-chain-fatty-acid-CoA ligase [Geomicrobium sp. JCM 19039]
MMNTPLTIPPMLERAERYFPDKEVISRTLDNVQRMSYRDIGRRTRALSSALSNAFSAGNRVATLAWNHHRHLEAYFAIPGVGAVIHTVNFRLPPEHLSYVMNHAEDRVVLVDEDLLPLIERVADQLTTVRAFIIMTDKPSLPETSLSPVYSYEDLVQEGDKNFSFVADLDENEPVAMCYTSATTGKPKGVLYSHRGIVLHSLSLGLTDSTAISEKDTALPVVPMFHVNAWGMPFAATWFGTTQVLPGPQFTPELIAQFIQEEQVTITAGVPTIWIGLLQVLEKGSYDTSSLRCVLCGGSAAPKGMIEQFENVYGIDFLHAYGMTETAPLATVSQLKSHQLKDTKEEQLNIRAKQGMAVPLVDLKAVNEHGEIKWDGKEMGELLIRGPWIADAYHNDERSEATFKGGWLYTGDVVTIDREGSIAIVDRTKDLIKSGGEWISSVDLENALMAHPGVLEAAVVAVPDEKWQERPMACVVRKEGSVVTEEELLQHLETQFVKWWVPDQVLFLEALPKTSVGKFLKRALREQVKDHARS